MSEGGGKYLYRYQPFYRKNKIHSSVVENLEMFSEKQLIFVSPLEFNDPFDCKSLFTYKECSIIDLYRFIHYNSTRALKGKSDAEIKENARQRLHEIIDQEVFNGDSELSKVFAKYKAEFIADIKGDAVNGKPGIGVLSLSEKKDDILMWGHYADGHKGYCLEFDRSKLEKWVKLISGKLARVVYSDLYPNIRDYMELTDEGPGADLDELFLLRKSSHWRYEEEWRIIVNIDCRKENPQTLSFPEHILTGVIFGIEMKDEQMKTIRGSLDRWNEKPKLYRADKSDSQYNVVIREID